MSVHKLPQITAYSSYPKTMFEHPIVEFSKEHVPFFYKLYYKLQKSNTDYILSHYHWLWIEFILYPLNKYLICLFLYKEEF